MSEKFPPYQMAPGFIPQTPFAPQLFVSDCGREACTPGHRYGPAMRSYTLIHIVASGSGIFNDGRKCHEVHAGQGFVIFPKDITVYTADSDAPWDYVWVGFAGELAEELASSCGLSRENCTFDLGRYAGTALKIAYSIYEDMSTLQQNNTAALGGLLRLTSYIAQSRFDASPQRAASAGADSYQRALWIMNANYHRSDFHVEDVASFVGLSRSQLFRIFKIQCGRSPQSMLSELRLSHAKRLLSGTDLSLTETAFSSGFSSAARMGEVFRTELHTTPLAYRKNARRSEET